MKQKKKGFTIIELVIVIAVIAILSAVLIPTFAGIIKKSKEQGLDLSENILTDAFNYVLRRWYDTDQKIAESFEYLKSLPDDLQKEVALDIINLLQREEAN